MSVLAEIIGAFVAGILIGGALINLRSRRREARLVRDFIGRVGPILDRRAALLGIGSRSSPEVQLSEDGELRVRQVSPVDRMLQLADLIDDHEHAQLGYIDTIRVSADDLPANVRDRARASSKP